MKKIMSLPLLMLIAGLAITSCKDKYANEKQGPQDRSCQGSAANKGTNHPKAAAYQALLNKYVAQGLPGVVLLVRSPKDGLWIGAAGKSNLETGEPMSPCTLNYPQSIAKTFTATAMMMLVEEEKVNLDAKISNYLPQATIEGIANADKATVRQMLNMTSGIVSYEQDEDWIASRRANRSQTFTPEVMLSYIRGDAADFEPGTSWRYSTTNYLLAALIIDQVTGRSHADMFTNRIFKPLQLTDIYYKNEPGYPRPKGLVMGNYYLDGEGAYGSLGNLSDWQTASVSSFIGDDGLISSAYDLAQFVEALSKGRLVNAQSLAEMTMGVNTGDPGVQYGLGLYKLALPTGGIAFGHTGDGVGAAAQMYYIPELEATYVAFTNAGTFFASPARDLFSDNFPTDVLTILAQ
jgi:D-alanyl-D-alanine carboxypeptidase